jgi:hypothetical protein
MNSSEYEEILASVQDVVQRAYALGRTEALKRVIEVMKADETPARPLALMAPGAAPAQPKAPIEASTHTAPVHSATSDEERPAWWARPARAAYAFPERGTNSTKH